VAALIGCSLVWQSWSAAAVRGGTALKVRADVVSGHHQTW
jgi:hypothetical protein